MELKSVVYNIANELNALRPTNIGILNAEGNFIASNFSENSHMLISKIVKQYSELEYSTCEGCGNDTMVEKLKVRVNGKTETWWLCESCFYDTFGVP